FHVPDPQPTLSSMGNPWVVFVVESPHSMEVRSGITPQACHPLAGETGRSMTKKFIENGLVGNEHANEALGVLVPKGCIGWVRVVCVSELPLQAKTYHQLFATGEADIGTGLPSLQGWGELMLAFDRVRGYSEKTSVQWPADDLDKEIMDDFRVRLRDATSNLSLIVALSSVAQAACRKAAAREKALATDGTCDHGVAPAEQRTWDKWVTGPVAPHPARNQWKNEPDKVAKMFKKVAEHLPRLPAATASSTS
ncbi:MAG: hypothetical protein OXH37_06535, partial [Gammaproteobacteria bacterium]|nr:hypothetical protein [Gammaproteobacteria bacterium]